MGYYSRGFGTLQLSRPLLVLEFKDSDFAKEEPDTILKFQIDEDVEEVPEGTLVRRTVSEVGWRYEDSVKMYTLDEEMDQLARFLSSLGVSAEGFLLREGEESGDVERYWIEDGIAHREVAKLIWPSSGQAVVYP